MVSPENPTSRSEVYPLWVGMMSFRLRPVDAREQLAIDVMPDHVHLFVSAPPTTAPGTIAKTLKSILALRVFKAFPTLKQQRFWGSGWCPSRPESRVDARSDGCYYGSAGTVSAATIAKHIENQKSKPE